MKATVTGTKTATPAIATAITIDNKFSALISSDSDSDSDYSNTDFKISDQLHKVYQAAIEADIQLLEESWISPEGEDNNNNDGWESNEEEDIMNVTSISTLRILFQIIGTTHSL